MVAASLFIGVVSYPGTRFPAAQGPDGFGARLAQAMRERGVLVDLTIDTTNRWDGEAAPLTHGDVQEALSAQVRLEDRWQSFLQDGAAIDPRARAKSVMRHARRLWRRLSPPSSGMVERLLNIEMAHTELLRAGLVAGSSWILILEDDGECSDIDDLADGLSAMIEGATDGVRFINLSESFEFCELGIEHLLKPSDQQWAGSRARRLVETELPVTNTVCAIAYSATFAKSLLEEYSKMPQRPVVPIDWKLNQALMTLHGRGELPPGSCLWVLPGPIDQLSMRASHE